MTFMQAIVIAAVQGTTELFPVSSLGHAIILPWLLNWKMNIRSSEMILFLVMLHLGTASALFTYFWKTWWSLISGSLRFGDGQLINNHRRLLLYVVVATVPVVIVGGLLEHTLRRVFVTPVITSVCLVVNGLILIFGERVRRSSRLIGPSRMNTITMSDAVAIGCWQCLALLPGLSRSGATMVGGLLRGLDHEAAAQFSFLIALPVILAASARELPSLFSLHAEHMLLTVSILGAATAAACALASTAFLMRYFHNREVQGLRPFAIYCILLGCVGVCCAASRTSAL